MQPISIHLLLLTLLFLLPGSGCGGPEDQVPADETAVAEPEHDPALLLPELARAEAPDHFQVRLETTKGPISVQVDRSSAPLGADRFYNLVRMGFFTDVAFFRVVPDFIAQFGIHGNPEINKVWSEATIRDDPPAGSNSRGTLSYAQAGPNSRSTQLFFNLKDNPELDAAGFIPIGKVTEGMGVLDSLYSGYGELYPKGKGPRPQLLNLQGNSYLRMHFPEMDYVKAAAAE
jgi:peptidyl-prolyl cis-trans isomerase A (cyclophilin A)